jgi:hypothetical protein
MNEETKKLVTRAEALAKIARPGPWWVSGDFVRAAAPNTTLPGIVDIADGMTEEDAEFIAHARQDVPALCATIREMGAEQEKERAAWIEYATAHHEGCSEASCPGPDGCDPAAERIAKARNALKELGVPSKFLRG